MNTGIALENSIMQKGKPAAAGSKILENFSAPFSAAVVERLLDAGVEITGRAEMREFGLGCLFENEQAVTSGAAKLLNDNLANLCLCNDLFGLYRREAAENGLCYIHPTYGTVSRYGLIPLASSMDQIGVLCKSLSEGFSLLSLISGNDKRDGAMFPDKTYSYMNSQKELSLLLPLNIIEQTDEQTQEAIQSFAEKFAAVRGNLDYFEVYKQVLYILSSAEISNNINRYDGVKFGYRSPHSLNLESLYTKTRTEAFGLETKLSAIMGAMVLSAEYYAPYYEKAMKLRGMIKKSLSFSGYDIIVLPSSIKGGSYDNMALAAVSALAGLPSVSFSYNGCGIQLVAAQKNESVLLSAWLIAMQPGLVVNAQCAFTARHATGEVSQ